MPVRSAPENGNDGGIRDTHHLRQFGQNYVMLREILEELILRYFHLFVCNILVVAMCLRCKSNMFLQHHKTNRRKFQNNLFSCINDLLQFCNRLQPTCTRKIAYRTDTFSSILYKKVLFFNEFFVTLHAERKNKN